MKVILKTDVNNLGEEGDIVVVAPGYARNFLLPRKMVVLHNAQNLAMLEARRAQIEKAKEEKRKAAASLKEKLNATVITIKMPAGENGKLFGSVSNTTLVEELTKLGMEIERKKVEVPNHVIKTTGEFKVRVRLYGNEEAEVKVSVVAQDEAKGSAKAAPKAEKAPEAPVQA